MPQFTRRGRAKDRQEIDDRQRVFTICAEFAAEVRIFYVPDATRLPLIEEWVFFAEMLRADCARLYNVGPSSASPAAEVNAQDRRLHNRETETDPPDRSVARSTRTRAERKASCVLAEFLEEHRQSNGNDSAQHDVGVYVEFVFAFLGDKSLRAYIEDDFARLAG